MSKVSGKVEELNAEQVKDVFGYIIDNNQRLAEKDLIPVSIGLTGESGIGKTSVLKQLAEEKGMDFLKLNLSQISLEDFVGFPLSEFKVKKGKEELWVSERLLHSYTELGYEYQGQNRMGYAKPKWIMGREKPLVLILDDYSRGSLGMLQATMEIIDQHEYISWNLPKGSTVILSSNPDDGNYFVTTEDSAQSSRYLNFHMKMDVDVWSLWAEGRGIDGRC